MPPAVTIVVGSPDGSPDGTASGGGGKCGSRVDAHRFEPIAVDREQLVPQLSGGRMTAGQVRVEGAVHHRRQRRRQARSRRVGRRLVHDAVDELPYS